MNRDERMQALQDVAEWASAAADTAAAAADELTRHVHTARQEGFSWAAIAACLGVTKQSAWKRWRVTVNQD